jgi:hypothetical protein
LRELETDGRIILNGLKKISGYRNERYTSLKRTFYYRSGNGREFGYHGKDDHSNFEPRNGAQVVLSIPRWKENK